MLVKPYFEPMPSNLLENQLLVLAEGGVEVGGEPDVAARFPVVELAAAGAGCAG